MSVVTEVYYNQRLEKVPIDVYSFVVRPSLEGARQSGRLVEEDALHCHSGVEIYYCRAGRGVYRFGDRTEIKLAPGVLLIFDATHPHGGRYELHEPYWGYAIHVRQSIYQMLVGDAHSARAVFGPGPILLQTRLSRASQVVAVETLQGIAAAVSGADPERHLRTNQKLIQLLLLARHAAFEALGEGHRRAIVRRIEEYVQRHLDQDLSVELIAERMGYNRSHLSRLFREETGEPLSAYIRRCRLERAAALLAETDLSMTEIGLSVGLGRLPHFSRAFRQAYSISPSAYRKQLRK